MQVHFSFPTCPLLYDYAGVAGVDQPGLLSSTQVHPGLLKRKPLGPMSLHPGLLSSASWHQVGKKKRMYHSVCEERETFFSKLDEPPHVLSFGLLCCILGGCWTEFLSPLARAKTSLGQGV